MSNRLALDVLHTALSARLLRGPVDVQDASTIFDWISADNRLLDACFDAGMPHETVNRVEWAAERCARDLVEA